MFPIFTFSDRNHFQGMYNGQYRGYPGQTQQFQGWGQGYAGTMPQQQGAMPGYQAGAAGFQGQAYTQPPATAQAGFTQQQQWTQQQQQQGQYGQQWNQQQCWGQDQGQWAQGQQWSGARAPAAPGMYPMQGQQQPVPLKQEAGKLSKAPATGEGMQPETYQRTLEYVQQCQSWSSPTSVMSPDSSQGTAIGAKPKVSSGQDSAAMPPPSCPPPMGEPSKPVQGGDGNMVIADMSSSLNTLMEENRYLHMMQ